MSGLSGQKLDGMQGRQWIGGKGISSIFHFPMLLAFDLKPRDLCAASMVH